ncbi:MAG TPA: carboxypeptidase regulatory-like domain-containing protein [Vicinamibacterales bacterium]|nr:carboxypeptidase regulatory-like domain-containing protein [Vicinamibacterales bacterium]
MTRSVPFALLLVLLSMPATAQQFKANLTGTVTDAQGAVVPGVTVTVTNTDTNVSTDAVTNDRGVYSVQQLTPGPYKITVALSGFKTFVREGLTLRTAETVTVNVALTMGAVEETVTVSAATSHVESNETAIAQTIENKRISELPLNGRQVYMLLQLTSGTLFTQTTFGATGFSGTRAWDVNGSLTIHGSRTSNNEFLVEGAPSSGTGGGTGSWNYAPPVDAIEEFKVSTSSVDASFGRTSGGVVNMTFRSGTNQLRGSGIMLHRGTWLDSNQIQNIRSHISNKEHKYFNGEGMVSGPIRHGKTFFMGGYQGFYENIPFPATRTIPTAAQLRGDFSQTTTANGTPILIYDPATTTCTANFSSCTRTPFPGNIIPQERWSPIAKALLPFIPKENATPSNLAGSSNFISSPNLGRYRYNSYLTRIDHTFSNTHRLSFSNSANWGIEFRNENALPEPAIRSDNYPTHRNHYLATVDDNRTIGGTMLWNTRFSWDRFDEPHEKQYGSVDPKLPFTGAYQLTGPPFPQINFDAYDDMFPRTFRRPKNDAYSASTTISKTLGRHVAKMGGEYRAYQFYRQDEVGSNGVFAFGNQFTRRDPLSNTGATSGNEFATFLLGLPTSGSVQTGTPRTEQYRYYAAFVQDDWTLSSRATVNVGLRYDYQPPVTVKDNLTVSGFDFNATNPLQSQLPQGAATINPVTGQPLLLKGGLLFANRGGPKSPFKSDWNNIQPRVGFTYKVNDWLVARSNYGRSYLGLSSSGQNGVYTTDFQRTTPFVSFAPNGVDPGTPWANPFPAGFLQPLAGELGLLTALGTGPTIPNPDYEIPYTDQWMAGADIQLPWKIGLDVAYVGNQVSKLGVSRNVNSVPKSENDKAIPSLGGNTGYLNVTFPNPFAGLVPGQGLNAATVSRGQLLRPYPQFTNFPMNRLNRGSAYYNALEAVATRRYSNGVMFAVNYTWMKLEDQVNFFTDYDTKPYRDIQGDQRRHRLVITTLVDLPFGPGKAIGGSTRGIVAGLIGGWQFNTIGEIQSGRPLDLNGVAIQLDPDVALPKSEQSFSRWFDNSSTALSNPRPDGTFAWSVLGANDYRVVKQRFHDVNEPTEPQWSFSLFKNTRVTQTMNMQVRLEAFNVFNVRVYGGPNTDPRQGNFGIVDTASQVNFPRTLQLGVRFAF